MPCYEQKPSIIASAYVIRTCRGHHEVLISLRSCEASLLWKFLLKWESVCVPGWARTTSWTWWPVRTCPSVSGPRWWDRTSQPWTPWLPLAPTRQSSRASSTSARTSSTISHWLMACPAPPPPRSPPGEEPRLTPAWLEATHLRRLRPRLPTSFPPPHLSSPTTAPLSTTTTTTITISTININISPRPTPLLPPLNPRSQPCCRPPCTPITPLRNNTRCEPGIKGKKEKKKTDNKIQRDLKVQNKRFWSFGKELKKINWEQEVGREFGRDWVRCSMYREKLTCLGEERGARASVCFFRKHGHTQRRKRGTLKSLWTGSMIFLPPRHFIPLSLSLAPSRPALLAL